MATMRTGSRERVLPVAAREPLPERLPLSIDGDPLDFLCNSHHAQLALCDVLEGIADSLPNDIDRRLCFRAAMALRVDISLHHLDEERGLFPLLRKRVSVHESLQSSLQRLESEHYADEGFSEEVIEGLEALSRARADINHELIGYMLRGFFESIRRHIAFENEVLLPLARNAFTSGDLDTLAAVMRQNRVNAPRALLPDGPCGDTLAVIWSED